MLKDAFLLCCLLLLCSFGYKKEDACATSDLKGKVRILREYKYGYTEGKLTHIDSFFYLYDKKGILRQSRRYDVSIAPDGFPLFRGRDRMYYQYADGKCVQRIDSTRMILGYVMVKKYRYDKKGRLVFTHEYPTPDTTGVTNERMNIAYSAKGDTAIFEVWSRSDTGFAFLEKWEEAYDAKGQKTHSFWYDMYLKAFTLFETYSYDAAGNMVEANSYDRDSSRSFTRNEFDRKGRLVKKVKGLIPGPEVVHYRESSEHTIEYSYHDLDKIGNHRIKVSIGEWKGSVDSTFRVIEYYP